MSRTHIAPPVICIPNPDLLDLVKKYLPGEAGISVMYSITGSLSLRAARLAGMVANGLASDIRESEHNRDTITTYNDAMSFLDVQAAAEKWFDEAGGVRQDMCRDLTQVLAYKKVADDYLVTLLGPDKMRVTNWVDTLTMAGEPMPVDAWKLDYLWKEYTTSSDADLLMTREEYDVLNIRELSGVRATWAKHLNAVLNVLETADRLESIEFFALDTKLQLSLLNSYATPERMAKFRASIMKRARSAFEFDANVRLHKGFVEACRLATTHHRYAKVGDAMVPKVEPKVTTAKQIASEIKARNDQGVHKDLIAESVDAEKRAAIANKQAIKRKPKGKVVAQSELKKELSLAAQPNDI
mgnify:FL=1